MAFSECFKEAKERLTIPELWKILALPGWPRKKCCSPFRDEKRASFSISKQGRYWKDHGEGKGGDVFDFYQEATGADKGQASKAIFEILGLRPEDENRMLPVKRIKPQPMWCGTEFTMPRENHVAKLGHDGVTFLNWKGIRLSVFDQLVKEGSIDVEADKLVFVYNTGRKIRSDWVSSNENRWLNGSAEGALWRYPQVLRPEVKTVVVCEGETDLMRAMSVMDIPESVALVSAPAASWRPDALLCATIGWGRNVVLAFDYDQAGIAATSNVAQLLNEHGECNKVRSFPWVQVDELGQLEGAKDLCGLRQEILQKCLDDCFDMR